MLIDIISCKCSEMLKKNKNNKTMFYKYVSIIKRFYNPHTFLLYYLFKNIVIADDVCIKVKKNHTEFFNCSLKWNVYIVLCGSFVIVGK